MSGERVTRNCSCATRVTVTRRVTQIARRGYARLQLRDVRGGVTRDPSTTYVMVGEAPPPKRRERFACAPASDTGSGRLPARVRAGELREVAS